MRKIILLLPLAVALSAVLAIALVQQDTGRTAEGASPSGGPPPGGAVNYTCYAAPTGLDDVGVSVENQLGPDTLTITHGQAVCPLSTKNGVESQSLYTLRCFGATGTAPRGEVLDIGDQYGFAEHIIGGVAFYCTPAVKDPATPQPPGPYYVCYFSSADVATNPEPIVSNQFVTDDQLTIKDARSYVCFPSLKFSAGDLTLPLLTCYIVESGTPNIISFEFITQFGSEFLTPTLPVIHCTEAVKLAPSTPTPTPSPTPTPPPSVNYTCYLTPPEGVSPGTVIVENQFGLQSITVLDGEYLCPPTAKNGEDGLALPTLRCHIATGAAPGGVLRIGDQYGIAIQTIGPVESYCTPATKDLTAPPIGPYYVCYDTLADIVTDPEPSIVNQFFPVGDDLILADLRDSFCVPSLKFGGGDLGLPPLVCYPVLDGTPADTVPFVLTQFGLSIVTSVGAPAIHCTEAEKLGKLPDPGDTDGDGCSDVKENRPKPDADIGGGRNWLNPWDFYDVAIAGGVKGHDSQIDLFNDIVGVIDHYAPTGLEPVYDAWYDRGPSAGPNGWNMTAPDNKIDLFNDIVGVIGQFGHDCR